MNNVVEYQKKCINGERLIGIAYTKYYEISITYKLAVKQNKATKGLLSGKKDKDMLKNILLTASVEVEKANTDPTTKA